MRELSRRGFLAFAGVAAAACKRNRTVAPTKATRVVSISASTTESMFAIGAGALMVGRSRYCDYPEAAKALPVVGGFVDPNLEAILALRPDLVIGAQGPLGPNVVRAFEDREIATYFPRTESFAEIVAMIEGLGDRTGHVDEARALTTKLRARKDAIAIALAREPRTRVAMLFSVKPISISGPGGFTGEMLTLAGGENILKDGPAYPTIAFETLAKLDPDMLIDAEMGPEAAGLRDFTDAWTTLRAVREKHVVVLTDEAVLRPGPRVLDGVTTLARAMHPNVVLP